MIGQLIVKVTGPLNNTLKKAWWSLVIALQCCDTESGSNFHALLTCCLASISLYKANIKIWSEIS